MKTKTTDIDFPQFIFFSIVMTLVCLLIVVETDENWDKDVVTKTTNCQFYFNQAC